MKGKDINNIDRIFSQDKLNREFKPQDDKWQEVFSRIKGQPLEVDGLFATKQLEVTFSGVDRGWQKARPLLFKKKRRHLIWILLLGVSVGIISTVVLFNTKKNHSSKKVNDDSLPINVVNSSKIIDDNSAPQSVEYKLAKGDQREKIKDAVEGSNTEGSPYALATSRTNRQSIIGKNKEISVADDLNKTLSSSEKNPSLESPRIEIVENSLMFENDMASNKENESPNKTNTTSIGDLKKDKTASRNSLYVEELNPVVMSLSIPKIKIEMAMSLPPLTPQLAGARRHVSVFSVSNNRHWSGVKINGDIIASSYGNVYLTASCRGYDTDQTVFAADQNIYSFGVRSKPATVTLDRVVYTGLGLGYFKDLYKGIGAGVEGTLHRMLVARGRSNYHVTNFEEVSQRQTIDREQVNPFNMSVSPYVSYRYKWLEMRAGYEWMRRSFGISNDEQHMVAFQSLTLSVGVTF